MQPLQASVPTSPAAGKAGEADGEEEGTQVRLMFGACAALSYPFSFFSPPEGWASAQARNKGEQGG